MLIGLPKEIKDNENRVGLTPGAVKAFDATWIIRYWYRVERHRKPFFSDEGISICRC